MSVYVPSSSRISAPQLEGNEPWLDPEGSDMTTFQEIKERWNISAKVAYDIAALRALPYEEYLRSPHWQTVKIEVHKRQDGKCALCNGCIRDVHHRTYARKGFERDEDVIGLCGNCHDIEHNAFVARLREEVRNFLQ